MDLLIDGIKNMGESEGRELIEMLFAGYKNRKKEGRLYEDSNKIPQMIILTYYSCVRKPHFNVIYEEFKNKYISVKNFKERYLYNENKLEEVHSKEEQYGLRKVYDYIETKDDFENISIYTISDIHELLYSTTPHPEFGRKYRTDQRFLPNTGIDITEPCMIVREMNELKYDVKDLVKEGIRLGKQTDTNQLMAYVDKCVELKCRLIKIHPFPDGNGRSIRAFINLLFRLANIPPVYIENKEREKYGHAMQLAVGDNDLSKIKIFYYYKICDSIISLDINLSKTDEKENQKNFK